jgi:hypothetical protein
MRPLQRKRRRARLTRIKRAPLAAQIPTRESDGADGPRATAGDSVKAMRSLQPQSCDAPGRALEARIGDVVGGLFRTWPALLGFSVQEAGEPRDDLRLADVEMQPWTARPEDALGEVALALLELVEEDPGALDLLRGRTFARTLH